MPSRMNCSRTETENAAAGVIVLMTSLSGIMGNLLVISSYFVTSYLRNRASNCLILNLSLTDLLSCMHIQIPCFLNLCNPDWQLLLIEGCRVHAIIIWLILTASKWSVAAISLDRAIAVNMPLKYPNIFTACKMRCIIAFIWLYSILVSIFLIDLQSISYNNKDLMCSPRWTKKNSRNGRLASVLCFWLPSTIVFLSTISVVRAVRRFHSVSSNETSEVENETNLTTNANDHMGTLRSFYVLVVVYFFCGGPYFLGKFSYVGYGNGMFTSSLMVFFMLLMFIASAVNPFIHSLSKEHFTAFKETAEMFSVEKKRILTRTKVKLKTFFCCCKMRRKNVE